MSQHINDDKFCMKYHLSQEKLKMLRIYIIAFVDAKM